ncbi:interleukin 17a/f2 [Brachyistius frenatus]|uniref:interleukin 17a/f2 n=1 Tax=Brachyistius frenatus TaxID=100188 RepID=UPI0037E88535
MKLLKRGFGTLLVCCSALWVVSSSMVKPTPPPRCNSTLMLSSNVSSLSGGNGDIHRRSLSPWRWRSSTVTDRIPTTLWEAECSSSFCSNPNPRKSDRLDLNSVPIYQNVLILSQRDGGGCYTASYQSVAVGCTCVIAEAKRN